MFYNLIISDLCRALRNSLNENLLASPIITNSSSLNDYQMKDNYNGDDDAYGRQSLDALASAALEASTHDNKLMSSGFNDGTMDVGKIELNDNIVSSFRSLSWNL